MTDFAPVESTPADRPHEHIAAETMQGRLAIVAKEEDKGNGQFIFLPGFSSVRTMKTILYLGSDPSHFLGEGNLIHYPVIQMIPRSKESLEVQQAFAGFSTYTHIIFTQQKCR